MCISQFRNKWEEVVRTEIRKKQLGQPLCAFFSDMYTGCHVIVIIQTTKEKSIDSKKNRSHGR